LSNGGHTITAKATDTAGNTSVVTAGLAITIDTTVPTVSALTLTNGGVLGTADTGDKVTITYAEQMDASKFCPAVWTNSGGQTLSGNGVSVTITNGGSNNDVLSVSATGCAFTLGSVALGGNYMHGSPIVFSSSTISLTTSGVLTITLGTGTSNDTGAVGAAPVYTPASGLTDIAGNPLATTSFNGTSGRL
jgi:hypothetical protein